MLINPGKDTISAGAKLIVIPANVGSHIPNERAMDTAFAAVTRYFTSLPILAMASVTSFLNCGATRLAVS